ncbi:MAG: hypothetical protein JJ992_16265, partial [Planctomycetes bacterium]|nr:hypothetical protein [Planctomycetota bacterium]
VDLDRLSAEQRIRLRCIERRLQVTDSDSPPRVATWLIDDPATWISLLKRDDESTRLVAARHLQTILDRPLDFDALADAPERARQLARLQTEFRLDRPVLVGDASSERELR